MPRRTQRRRAKSAPSALVSNRPKKRRQWSEDAMRLAMEAASRGEGVNRLAEMYGVPSTTMKDRISGRVVHGTKPGPKP